VSERVARSRELVAQGRPAALVARVAGISRQAIYRRPKRPPTGQRRPLSATDRVVLDVAHANPTDGTRMVAALAGRDLGGAVNRKRVQRLMREHRLLQPNRSEGRRRRPGYFRVTRPDELWHLDMTSVWVAEHGWCYLNAAIDCCTREIVGWAIDVRCRAHERIAVIDRAVAERRVGPGELTLGSDNGTAGAHVPPACERLPCERSGDEPAGRGSGRDDRCIRQRSTVLPVTGTSHGMSTPSPVP
jgi:putative transposase